MCRIDANPITIPRPDAGGAYNRPMVIRRATVADVPVMAQIINNEAEQGLMLPRSLSYLYENVREFQVVEDDASDAGVVGVCALSIIWANMAEVQALAVRPEHRGRGLGKQLVRACLDEAAALGIRRVMTLTYERAFFEKLGFTVLDRQQLPLKVWSECVRCPKNQHCDETAMVRELTDVPEVEAPAPAAPAPYDYVVPIVRKNV